jgi:hypothetical protein
MLACFAGGAVLVALAMPGGGRPVETTTVPATFTLQAGKAALPINLPTSARRSPRLDFRDDIRADPQQFAALRALPAERGRYRSSPINAKLEWKLSGDLGGVDSQIGVSGVPRMISRALLR